jgi:hypothetical protein
MRTDDYALRLRSERRARRSSFSDGGAPGAAGRRARRLRPCGRARPFQRGRLQSERHERRARQFRDQPEGQSRRRCEEPDRDQAKQIYHDKYWVPSGAESLPANMQAPYFDVYIRNPAFAKKALAESGGDPAKFMAASSPISRRSQEAVGQPTPRHGPHRDAKNTAIATGAGPEPRFPASPWRNPDMTKRQVHRRSGRAWVSQCRRSAWARKPRKCAGDPRRSDQAMEGDGHFSRRSECHRRENKSGLAELAKIAQMKAQVQTAENTASPMLLRCFRCSDRRFDRLADLQRLAAGGTARDRRFEGLGVRCRGQDALDRICPRDVGAVIRSSFPTPPATKPTR